MESEVKKYRAFGMKISSEIRIPELEDSNHDESDVYVESGFLSNPISSNKKYASKTKNYCDGFLCYINGIGGVRICNERKIIVSPCEGAEDKGFRFLVSGIALGLLLHLRGFVTLHASAVAIQQQAISFIGQKGMGKSTTAAALHTRGHPIVTDDLLVLDITNDSVQVYPGFPHLKLTPESIIKSVNQDPDHVPKIDPKGPKHSFTAEKDFLDEPLPLRGIYVLDYHKDQRTDNGSSAPLSEAITGNDACIELVRNSYVARLLPQEAISPHHLKRSAEIAQSVPVRRLYREKSLENLSSLATFIEQEQASGANGRSSEAPTGSQKLDRPDKDAL